MKSLRYFLVFLFFFSINYTTFSQVRINRLPRDNYKIFKMLPKLTDAPIPVIRTDFWISLRDGVPMDALKFIPSEPAPAGGWPVVIMVHGYGDNKETLANFCMAQAEYGYYTATYSVRGQGNSGGLSNLISTTEAQDLVEFVNAIKNDSVNGANPDRILIMGGSQGGLLPLMAASRYDLNVKTIISALAPADFASSWIENGSVKMTFLWTVEYTPDTARYSPQVERMSDWVYASTSKKYWDSLAYWLPMNRDFMTHIPNNTIPVMVEGSWQDKFFNAAGLINEVNLLKSPFRTYIGAVQGHGGDQSPTEDTWHMNFFNDWFFRFLFDQPLHDVNKFEYAYTTYPLIGNKWTFIHGSSNIAFTNMTSNWKLYFNRNGVLKNTANTTNDSTILRNVISGGLTMQEAVNEEFTGPVFNSKFRKNSVAFTTSVLTADYQMLGTPKINLNYSSTASPFCQFNFQIYEVRPDGSQWLVNRLSYTDRNYSKNSKKIVNFRGHAHSHIFKKGNRLRIVLTNLDTSPADTSFMASNPFVLPVLINQSNKMYLNNNSYIDIPVIPFISADNAGDDLVKKYGLEGNYPNPFNPVTNIKFFINTAAPDRNVKVKLVIYDIIGREVSVLLNDEFSSGNYEVKWNASDLASGIYFYNLIVDDVNADTKKMLLVK